MKFLALAALATSALGLGACSAESFRPKDGDVSLVRSLTGANYTGKKYYLGWGAAASSDPSMMHNEVKYDVLHTHDVFTEQVGGRYIGTKEIGSQVNGSTIRGHWSRLAEQMGKDDMFVQYSSGHGFPQGLAVGVNYDDIRDNALRLKAREVVIFTMACHSGGLVDSFKRKQAELDRMKADGRTLFVMASSTVQQTSSTGPGTDQGQQGPNGSAGSAFGHALWKALAGYADGEVDGVKDGFIDASEIEAYTKRRTQQIGRHTPVAIGFNYRGLIMNEVPTLGWAASRPGSSEGASDEEIAASVRAFDEAMAREAAEL